MCVCVSLCVCVGRGSELLREVAWVVFDEVHYMQDRERGVVWEETIIFLPREVKMVFLSATLSNASEFAAWVAQVSLCILWICPPLRDAYTKMK